MNKKRTIITAFACTAMTVATQAQENLIKAFDDFLNSKSNSEYIKTDMFVDNMEDKTYYYNHSFNMPKNKEKEIEKLRNAFNKDINKAYKVMIKSAGSNSNENLQVGYGRNNEKTISFGSHPQRNYMVMLVHDKCDSLKRYCYGLVWYTDTAGNRLCGSLHKIYGKTPAKNKTLRRYLSSIGRQLSNTENNENNTEVRVYNNGVKVYDNGVRVYGIGNNTVVRVYNDSIKSDIDFLQMFGNLTVAYKDKIREIADGESLVIGISNKILALCRNYGYLLNKTEKETCIETLKDLPRITGNKYINGILKEAMNALKESKKDSEACKRHSNVNYSKVITVTEHNINKWK